MLNFFDVRVICYNAPINNFVIGRYEIWGIKYAGYVDRVKCDRSFHATNPEGHTQYVVCYEDCNGDGGSERLCPECYAHLLHELTGGEVRKIKEE
ncbi:MAG: hypothetical protein SVY53_05140 [Chloroflexota bacterium]|nr:hypothetical protein [Chloroflexota bacterium]